MIMIESSAWTVVALLVIVLWAATAVAAWVQFRRFKKVPRVEVAQSVMTELADLRHLKAQLDHPPQQHNHVWPREPDVRKMGWLRYHCSYANCAEIKWVPKQ